jgi:DNA repair exonuclease SbcCD ATPase subunit
MSTTDELAVAVRQQRRILDALHGEARSVLTRRKELTLEIQELGDEISIYDRVTALLNSLGEERQMKAQQTIEDLVTRGLQTIFDDTLSFHILQTLRGKTANVEFVVRSTLTDTVVDTPVMDARGGGLAATIGFLLRVVVMLLRDGQRQDNVMILDETFAHVSDEYLPGVGQFLREIVDKTGIQVILVTHQPSFEDYADKVHRFRLVDGRTEVTEGA